MCTCQLILRTEGLCVPLLRSTGWSVPFFRGDLTGVEWVGVVGSKARSPPPPSARLHAERGTADPVHPASPLPPSQAPHLAGHYPATPRSPPNTSSPRRRRRRPESGWGRPGGGFTSILRPDSPLPTPRNKLFRMSVKKKF